MGSDLDFDLKQMSSLRPKPVHKVQLRHLRYTGQITPTTTDYYHTFLLLVPKNAAAKSPADVIVADATYAQYSFARGIDTLEEYYATKVHDRESCALEPFGVRINSLGNNSIQRNNMKAVIRTTNNFIVQELMAIGGIDVLLEMSTEDFQVTQDRIFDTLKVYLGALRDQLNAIRYNPDETSLARLDALVKDCDGDGHQACRESYQRAINVAKTTVEVLEPWFV